MNAPDEKVYVATFKIASDLDDAITEVTSYWANREADNVWEAVIVATADLDDATWRAPFDAALKLRPS